MKFIYLIQAEVNGLPGSEMPSNFKGAFVDCFILSNDVEEAIVKVCNKLREDMYEVLKIEKSVKFIDTEWGKQYKDLAKEALESEEVIYSEFYCYV